MSRVVINESRKLSEGIIQCNYVDDATFGTATISDGVHTYVFQVDKTAVRDRNRYHTYMDFNGKYWSKSFNDFINSLINDGVFTSVDGKWKVR